MQKKELNIIIPVLCYWILFIHIHWFLIQAQFWKLAGSETELMHAVESFNDKQVLLLFLNVSVCIRTDVGEVGTSSA